MANLITDAIGSIRGNGEKANPATDGTAGGSGQGSESEYADVTVIDDSSFYSSHDSTDESNPLELEQKETETADSTGEDSTASADGNTKATSTTSDAKGKQQANPNKETITISDDQGRRKLEIDYTDRAAIRKAHEMAAAARKWQVERDRERADRARLAEQHTRTTRVVDALEKAYAEKGEMGVIDLISGKPGASAEFIQRQIDRAKFLEKASPEQKAALEQKERLETLERELTKQRTENEEREKRVISEREAAELRSTEATVHPVFEKHRFDGKLGDAETETMFDEMLWNSALKRLKPYEERGLPMTRELVDREFRTVATALRKRIGVQAEKKAASVVEQKKHEATENAQASTLSAYKRGGATAEANELLNKGDFAGFFRSFGKSSGRK